MSELTHDDARVLASRAVDAPLEGDQERELALHLVGCESCKAFYDNLHRARSAFRRATTSQVPTEVLEAAVHRATTVLEGAADPGPPEGLHEDTGPLPAQSPEDGAVPTAAPAVGPPTAGEEEPPADEETTRQAPGPEQPVAEQPLETPGEPGASDVFDVEGAETTPGTPTEEPHAGPDEPTAAPEATPPVAEGPPGTEPPRISIDTTSEPEAPVGAHEEPEPPAAAGPEPPDEPQIEETTAEEVAAPTEPRRRRASRTVPTVLAIVATIAVAALAFLLVLNRSAPESEQPADLPDADRIRTRVSAVFDDLASLEATYTIDRLSLYRLRQEDGGRVVYSFSNGRSSGRIVFEDPTRLRQERTFEVQNGPTERSTIVRTADEYRILEEGEDGEEVVIIGGYGVGPPSTDFRPELGVLEEAVGSVLRLAADARDLEVLEQTTVGDRQAYRIRFSVSPTTFTRSDRVEMIVDARTFFPYEVRRSIARDNADVLGPPELLGADALDTAFGERDRITTELVRLDDVVLDDVVLPGEFALEPPEGAETTELDGGFEGVPRTDLLDEVSFPPLLPGQLPPGFREEAFLVFTGEPTDWGPEDAYPAPDGILQSVYSDGKLTVVISQRRMEDGAFEVETSPLDTGGLPMETEEVVRGGNSFTYAISPEVPPHLYGFVGDVLVTVTGYLPQEDLVRIAGSLAPEEPAETSPDGTTDE